MNKMMLETYHQLNKNSIVIEQDTKKTDIDDLDNIYIGKIKK